MADKVDSRDVNGMDSAADIFAVKGKPNISMRVDDSRDIRNLKTILSQKVEEWRAARAKDKKIVTATPGSEFKPENMPYIPGATNPILTKHDLATLEKNAGYADASMVPPMYKDQMKRAKDIKEQENVISRTATPMGGEVTLEVVDKTPDNIPDNYMGIPFIDETVDTFEKQQTESTEKVDKFVNIVEQQKSKDTPPKAGQQPEFKLGVNHDKAFGGGHFIPNESRPYRPGS